MSCIHRHRIPSALAMAGILWLGGCQSNTQNPAPPPPQPPPQAQAGTLPEQAASPTATPDETVEQLDRQLAASLEEHDAMLRERQAVAGAAAAQAAAQQAATQQAARDGDAEATAAAGDDELYEDTSASERAPDRDDAMAASSSAAGAASSASRQSVRNPAGGTTAPHGIPDGRDDDIVARQLREAAQAETDPALREKLWHEYRRYKNQQAAP